MTSRTEPPVTRKMPLVLLLDPSESVLTFVTTAPSAMLRMKLSPAEKLFRFGK